MDAVDEVEVESHCDGFYEAGRAMYKKISREAVSSVSLEGFQFREHIGDFSVLEWPVNFLAKSGGQVCRFQ